MKYNIVPFPVNTSYLKFGVNNHTNKLAHASFSKKNYKTVMSGAFTEVLRRNS